MISVSRAFLTGVVVGVEDEEAPAVATVTLMDGWSGVDGRSGVGSTEVNVVHSDFDGGVFVRPLASVVREHE